MGEGGIFGWVSAGTWWPKARDARCPTIQRTVPRKNGPYQTPVAPPLRNTTDTPLSLWETEAQRWQCLVQHQTGGFCELKFRFSTSVMFYLKLSSDLIHDVTNQGDCFNTVTVPSAAMQIDTVCGIPEVSLHFRILA